MLLYPNIALFLKLICPLIISYMYIKHSDHTYPFPFISSSCPEKPLPSFLPLKPFPIFAHYFFFFVIHCPMCMDTGVKQPTRIQEAHQCLLHWRWSLPVLSSSWLILAPLGQIEHHELYRSVTECLGVRACVDSCAGTYSRCEFRRAMLCHAGPIRWHISQSSSLFWSCVLPTPFCNVPWS